VSTVSEPRAATTTARALLPLRLFLGVTFAYAGVQKLSDPGFLHPGAPTYIGTQLHGFADHTPGGVLLRTFAIPHPQLAGIAVALTEIVVGLLVLVGLGTRVAAAVGLSLNLVLFLTASWRTSPYFLGSDIVFVFAWLPFVLGGSAGQPALERRATPEGMTRRQALASGYAVVAGASVVLAGLATALKGRPRAAQKTLARTPTPTATPRHAARRRHVPAGAVRLGASTQLPAGSGALYTDPTDGQADIVVRQPSGALSACSAICTHAGCRVEYTNGALFCPCHGSVFDSRTGAVRQGPATQPLAVKRVVERNGSIYALPS
jgi:thiosulfate dehydrogenase (quinone) large subunit